jgi:nitroreductase
MQTQTIQSTAQAKPAIHELLANRWSPRSFSSRPVETERLAQLFEAARWAPSSYNAQPWSFIVATREDAEGFTRLLSTLVEPNRQWAQNAPVLILGVTKRDFIHADLANRHAMYDLGQGVANLTLEASTLGLQVHQMGGFDSAAARELFSIPEGYEAGAMLALGYPDESGSVPDSRSRKPLTDFVFSGRWGTASQVVTQHPNQGE